ncbi:hypothetical protein DAI22_10g031300 [Oryza sativa Japonica Group]|nr:hypothetical protein DAI22_10g031300 [Oryza sativa Japonica Group]
MRRSKKQRPRCCRRLLRRLELLVVGLWRSQGQAAEVFLLDLAAEELNLGPSMNNEATSIPKELRASIFCTHRRDHLAGSYEPCKPSLPFTGGSCMRNRRDHSVLPAIISIGKH